MDRRVVLAFLAVLLLVSCADASPPPSGGSPGTSVPSTPPDATPGVSQDVGDASSRMTLGRAVRFVALGDSYTIGTDVRPRERWPNQLVRALRPDIQLILSANLGRSGATSEDVVLEQLPQLRTLRPNLVSLLVGVNDVVVGTEPETYRANVATILDAILERLPADRVVVITTPDYTLTPRGGDYGDREEQRAGIVLMNAIATQEARVRGMHVVDISAISDRVMEDPSLLADDALHPSAKQYAGWVELIARSVRQALRTGD